MSARAYYNEHDINAAAWIRELIRCGHVADGVVDERSIEDVCPRDLEGFTQCHFFAGIGVWSYALRAAGWADDRPVWTGSCPCQPFSAAGKGAAFADERHLWPAWHHLIKERRPAIVFGEQVASSDAGPWIDLVHDDMEALGYAFGAIPFPAAGVGAPHIRDRLYFVAHAERARVRSGRRGAHGSAARGVQDADGQRQRIRADAGTSGDVAGRVADSERNGGGREATASDHVGPQAIGSADRIGGCGGALGIVGNASSTGLALGLGLGRVSGGTRGTGAGQAAERTGVHAGELADADGGYAGAEREQRSGEQRQQPEDGGAVRGFWSDADWIECRDGKARPVEPGAFPLAHGSPARVVRLRGYGNGLVAPQAQAFIEASMSGISA